MDGIDERIAALAAQQYGVFCRADVLALGGSDDHIQARLASGRWHQLHLGVYCIAGTPPGWERDLLAACLAAGGNAVASHRAAAALWGLDGIKPGVLELTVPRARAPAVRGAIIHRTRAFDPAAVTERLGIPTMTVVETVISLGAVCRPQVVELAFESALRKGLLSVDYTTRKLMAKRGPGRKGPAALAAVLEARGDVPPAGSTFEVLIIQLLRAHGLPTPERQYKVMLPSGPAFIDLAYPEPKVAIEVLGFQWHDGRKAAADRDRARRDELLELGWYPLEFTWHHYKDRPEWLVGRVLRGLDRLAGR